ncbi:putative secreted protein [Pseudomonas aeruginosa PA38182]|nr:putative secreted protein [Pseudomonas aeruginosa PA38182]
MNASHPAQRSTAAVVIQSLFWLWLIGLSVIVALGYLAMRDQTDQDRLDSRLQRLEAQATGLAETIEAIQQRPAVATAADLKDTRQVLEARAAQVEKSLSGYAAADDLQALRAEIEQIKTRQTAARAAAPAQPRASRPAAASKAQALLPARGVLPWHQAQPGRKLAARAELPCITGGCRHGAGADRADTFHRQQALDAGIATYVSLNLSLQSSDARLQRLQFIFQFTQQLAHRGRQGRRFGSHDRFEQGHRRRSPTSRRDQPELAQQATHLIAQRRAGPH